MDKAEISGELGNIRAGIEQIARKIEWEHPSVESKKLPEYRSLLEGIELYKKAVDRVISREGQK